MAGIGEAGNGWPRQDKVGRGGASKWMMMHRVSKQGLPICCNQQKSLAAAAFLP